MKDSIKKGQVITRGFICNYDRVSRYEALNDAEEGKFVKLAEFYYYEGANGEMKKEYTGEVLKKKVLSNYEGAFVSF